MKKKITKDTAIGEAISINPKAAIILMKRGLSCVGCPMAVSETIEQGASAHGLSKKEISDLLKVLNQS